MAKPLESHRHTTGNSWRGPTFHAGITAPTGKGIPYALSALGVGLAALVILALFLNSVALGQVVVPAPTPTPTHIPTPPVK